MQSKSFTVNLVGIAILIILLVSSASGEVAGIDPALREKIEMGTLRPYFNALRNGNLELIGKYNKKRKQVQDDVVGEVDRQFEEKILKSFYKGVLFTIERAVLEDALIIIDVLMEFPGKGRARSRFFLQDSRQQSGAGGNSMGNGHWIITDEQPLGL